MTSWGPSLLGCSVLVACCLTLPATAAPSTDPERPQPSVRPVAEVGGVLARDVALSSRMLRAPLRTGGVDLVGVTWRGAAGEVRLRSGSAGSWTAWRTMPLLHDGPDRGSPEAAGVRGTDLLWVGGSDLVQVDVAGPRPEGLSVALIDVPSEDAGARTARTTAARGGNEFRPHVFGRDAWRADPRLRQGRPSYNRTIQQVHVHHTVNSNDYAAADVPGLIRGIYRYHTVNLGWSDIGYNFLVDRFGRTWTGRAGGIKRAVRGAHTLGFNSTSTGVALIGNFELAPPSRRALTAVVRLAAWKLHHHDRPPRGRVTVFSHGSDRFAAGQRVRLPVIDGHRDTSETACPGALLYERLPGIRRRAAERIVRYR